MMPVHILDVPSRTAARAVALLLLAAGFVAPAHAATPVTATTETGGGVLSLGPLNRAMPATARAARFGDPVLDMKASTVTCAPGSDCAVPITTEVRRRAGDTRRVAIFADLAIASGQVIGSDGGWRCTATIDGPAVCTARLDQIPDKGQFAITARLAAAPGDARLCLRPPRLASSGAITGDMENIRLIQVLLGDSGRAPGPIDGRWRPQLRAEIMAVLQNDALGTASDDVLAAAYLGDAMIRAPVTTPPCLALLGPVAGETPVSTVLPSGSARTEIKPAATPTPLAKKPAASDSRPKPPPGYVYRDDMPVEPPPGAYAQPRPRLFPRLRLFGTP